MHLKSLQLITMDERKNGSVIWTWPLPLSLKEETAGLKSLTFGRPELIYDEANGQDDRDKEDDQDDDQDYD